MSTTKSHISLKYKEMNNGKKSIYLDYYKDGKRIREALHLYLLPETSRKNINANRRTMKEAEAVRTVRENGMIAARFGIDTGERLSMRIGEAIDEYEKIYRDRGDTSSANNTRCMKRAVNAYQGLDTKVTDIDEEYCNGLVDFLHESYAGQFGKIRMTTARSYIYLFSGMLNNAVSNGIIGVNPLRYVNIHGRITRERPLKDFLTVEEIRNLMDTPCPVISRPQVKQAFMLSVFTYLSSADVITLKWKDIRTDGGRTTIKVHSRKSSVPLTPVSMRWLPETTNHRGLVFKGLPKSTEISNILLKWSKNAGLKKTLSFRLAQNTFIYLLLTSGTDIGTISCMLGLTPGTMKGYMKMIAAGLSSETGAASEINNEQ